MSLPAPWRAETLALYKRLLRASQHIPLLPVRRKTRANIRELFALYRHESDPNRCAWLRSAGIDALGVMQTVTQGDPEIFSLLARKAQPTQRAAAKAS